MHDGPTLPSATPARLAAPAPYELWRVDLRIAPSRAEAQALSPDEQARAARFTFDRDRARYVAAHAALRRLLAAHTGREAAALRLMAGPYGKPCLDPPSDCRFNLSHSGDLALVALAPGGEIGVDVELLRPVPDAYALAERHYTGAEREALARAAAAGRDRAFLMGWTRKEACLKAIGSGLSIEALLVDAGLEAERRVVVVPSGAGPVRVEVESLASEAGWVGALARVLA